jgi:hypothetical protein
VCVWRGQKMIIRIFVALEQCFSNYCVANTLATHETYKMSNKKDLLRFLCVATCCSIFLCVATCFLTFLCVATCFLTFYCVATCFITFLCVARQQVWVSLTLKEIWHKFMFKKALKLKKLWNIWYYLCF